MPTQATNPSRPYWIDYAEYVRSHGHSNPMPTIPHRTYWVEYEYSDERPNPMSTMPTRATDSPRVWWVEYDYPHEHSNLTSTTPPYPYWADNDHPDEHFSRMYSTVRQQRSLFPPPSPPDSGYHSPSKRQCPWRRRLEAGNAMPTPSALSSGYEADSDSSGSSRNRSCEKEEGGEKKRKRKFRDCPSEKSNSNNNIFSRGLKRARKCISAAVLATGRKFSPSALGAEKSVRIGGLDGKAGNANASKGADQSSTFAKAMRKLKETKLFWTKEPERLKPA